MGMDFFFSLVFIGKCPRRNGGLRRYLIADRSPHFYNILFRFVANAAMEEIRLATAVIFEGC